MSTRLEYPTPAQLALVTYEYHTDVDRFAVLCRAEGLILDLESLVPMVPREKRPVKP
jgi:hypothetical protein